MIDVFALCLCYVLLCLPRGALPKWSPEPRPRQVRYEFGGKCDSLKATEHVSEQMFLATTLLN